MYLSSCLEWSKHPAGHGKNLTSFRGSSSLASTSTRLCRLRPRTSRCSPKLPYLKALFMCITSLLLLRTRTITRIRPRTRCLNIAMNHIGAITLIMALLTTMETSMCSLTKSIVVIVISIVSSSKILTCV